MSPDDPRHGTHAGAVQHYRDDTEFCVPCRVTERRYRKKLRHIHHVVGAPRVELGTAAWCLLNKCTPAMFVATTGLSLRTYKRLRSGGPSSGVLRETRDLILANRPAHTPVGVQRRLQALAAIGYSSPMLADLIGTYPSTLNKLRRRPVQFVRADFARRVVAVYDDLYMTPVFVPVSSAAARTEARKFGWSSPLAWDDIDMDDEPQQPDATNSFDDVAIERALTGDRSVRLSIEERCEATRRWQERGGSIRQLEMATGWNPHRDKRKAAA